MNKVTREFVSDEPRQFRFKVGHLLASSLAGFVAGSVFASIVWGIIVYYLSNGIVG